MSGAHAVCTGCNRSAADLPEYTEDSPVTDDGTFQDGRFVCDLCYMVLVDAGLDIGSPIIVQERARRLCGGGG